MTGYTISTAGLGFRARLLARPCSQLGCGRRARHHTWAELRPGPGGVGFQRFSRWACARHIGDVNASLTRLFDLLLSQRKVTDD